MSNFQVGSAVFVVFYQGLGLTPKRANYVADIALPYWILDIDYWILDIEQEFVTFDTV